jgi:hypothetical protein
MHNEKFGMNVVGQNAITDRKREGDRRKARSERRLEYVANDDDEKL